MRTCTTFSSRRSRRAYHLPVSCPAKVPSSLVPLFPPTPISMRLCDGPRRCTPRAPARRQIYSGLPRTRTWLPIHPRSATRSRHPVSTRKAITRRRRMAAAEVASGGSSRATRLPRRLESLCPARTVATKRAWPSASAAAPCLAPTIARAAPAASSSMDTWYARATVMLAFNTAFVFFCHVPLLLLFLLLSLLFFRLPRPTGQVLHGVRL